VGIVYFPTAYVTTLTAFIVLRFIVGLVLGGIDPNRLAYIRQEAPLDIQGEVLGYNTSLRFFGNMIGPTLGGAIASLYGFSALFFIMGLLLVISGFIIVLIILAIQKKAKK